MKHILLVLLLLSFCSSPIFGQAVEEPPKKLEQEKSAESAEKNEAEEQDPESEQDSKGKQKDSEPDAEPNQKTESSSRTRRRNRNAFTKKSENFVSVFSAVISSARDSVVEISDGKKQIALGTIVDSDGLVLTKASELKGTLSCKLTNGKSFEPEIVGIDPETDLVLLKLATTDLAAAPFVDSSSAPPVGSWLVTVNQEEKPLSIGIVSHEPREIQNNVPNSAVMGIFPRDRTEDAEGVRINQVLDDTPAEKSGLLVNDVILTIDDEKIENSDKLRQKLSEFQPGDEITLLILRGKEEKTVKLTLGRSRVNPMMDRGNRQNRMGSILSKRRSDFPLALQHDSILNANECGGPVVDLSGKVIGVNIARDGRVSTLVLPNSVILPVIAKLKSGEYSPLAVNRERIERVKRQLATIDTAIGDLPSKKTEKEIEFSAGVAIELEIGKQITDLEARLKALKARHAKRKKENRQIDESVKEVRKKLEANAKKREQLEFDLKRLKTGVR